MTSPERVSIDIAVRDAGASAAIAGVEKQIQGLGTASKTAATDSEKALAKVDTALGKNNTSYQNSTGAVDTATRGMQGSMTRTADHAEASGTRMGRGLETGVRNADVAGAVAAHGPRVAAAAGTAGESAGRNFGASMMTGFMAAGFVVGAGKLITDSVDTYMNMAVDTAKMKRITGGTTEDASRLNTELQLSGVDQAKGTTALTIFSKNLGKTADDEGLAAKTAAAMGISFTDAAGAVLPLTELLPQLSDKFKSMPDGAEKTALAMKLFGRSGADMLPFLNKGSDALAGMAAKSDELGLTLNDSSMTAMSDAKTESREFDASIKALKVSLGEALLPALTAVHKFLSDFIIPAFKSVGGFIKDNSDWLVPFIAGVLGLATAFKIASVAMAIFTAVSEANIFVKIATLVIALAAAVAWAYNNVQWFHDLVDAVWGWLGPFMQNTWDNFLKPVFSAMWTAITAVGDALSWFWTNVIVPVWNNAILPAIEWAWQNIIKPYFEAWWAIVSTVGGVYIWLWNNIIVPIWQNLIVPAIQWAWENILKPLFEAWWSIIQTIGSVYEWLWNNIVVPIWQNLIVPAFTAAWAILQVVFAAFKEAIDAVSTALSWLNDNVIQPVWLGAIKPALETVWNDIIKPAWDDLKGFMDGLGAFFDAIFAGISTAVTNVKTAIGEITDAVKSFLGLTFSTTVDPNGGIVTSTGAAITAAAGGNVNDPMLAYAQAVGGGAEGGWVSGPGTTTSDDVLIRASDQEFIVAAAPAAKYRRQLEAINADRYATGGLVQAGYDKAYSSVATPTLRGLHAAESAMEARYAPTPTAGGGSGSSPYTGALSGGVEQWRALALQALAMTGQSAADVGALLHQMDTESSGNPNVWNTTDINAQRGTPSGGLMQVIKPTFDSYALAPYNTNLLDPLSNILASIRYVLATYGSLANGYQGHAYDLGGPWPSGTAGFNASGETEYVQTAAERRAHLAEKTRGGGTTVTVAAGAVQIVVQGDLNNSGQVRSDLEKALRDILADDAGRRY